MLKAWAAPPESVKTGPAFCGRGGGGGVWFVLSLDTQLKKKDLKAKYALTLSLYPTKKAVIIIFVHYHVIKFRFLY